MSVVPVVKQEVVVAARHAEALGQHRVSADGDLTEPRLEPRASPRLGQLTVSV